MSGLGIKLGLQRFQLGAANVNPSVETEYDSYALAVSADSGNIRNAAFVKDSMQTLKGQNILDATKILISPEFGIKKRTSTIYNYLSKCYDASSFSNNLVQATDANQPFLCGNLAPNEKYGLRTPNGASLQMTHPEISFSNIDQWSATFAINWFGSNNATSGLFGKNSTVSAITLRDGSINRISFTNESGTTVNGTANTSVLCGFQKVVMLVANGTSLLIYVDNILFDTLTIATGIKISSLIKSLSTASTEFYGDYKYYRVQAGAMTPTNRNAEYAMLRRNLQVVETVSIADKNWASSSYEGVCSVAGNMIPLITDNAVWAATTTLYNSTYNARISAGDSVYVATKKANIAAAGWRYANNDMVRAGVFGKSYNGYAMRLLCDDLKMVESNVVVPIISDITRLSTKIGGNTVSAGKLKQIGTTHWDSPNTDASNETGFTAIGAAYINAAGAASIGIKYIMWVDERYVNYGTSVFTLNSSKAMSIYTRDSQSQGFSIRLNSGIVPFNKAKLVLSFDDGWTSQYTHVFPLLESKGIKGTVYLIGSAIGTANYMSWSNAAEMRTAGQDIQCHTYSHVALSALTQANVLKELTDNDAVFASNGMTAPTVMSYPFWDTRLNMQTWIKDSGLRTSIRGGFDINNPLTGLIGQDADRFNIPCRNVGPETISAINIYKRLIDISIQRNMALFLTAHRIVLTDAEVTDANIITLALLEAIIDYAQSKGVDIITHSQLSALLD